MLSPTNTKIHWFPIENKFFHLLSLVFPAAPGFAFQITEWMSSTPNIGRSSWIF